MENLLLFKVNCIYLKNIILERYMVSFFLLFFELVCYFLVLFQFIVFMVFYGIFKKDIGEVYVEFLVQ